MTLNRRSFVAALLAAVFATPAVMGCSDVTPSGPPKTKVYVMGVIHSNHLASETYSLDVLENAIRRAAPDVILTEIPPDRIEQAITSFEETGKVDEPRTQVFPEYTDVVFPLSREMGFRILGTAGWTQEIATNRARALRRIQNDPARLAQWEEHRAATRTFSRDLAGRGDDPRYIHTPQFDVLAKASRGPYERYFDADLGAGGWTRINRAHTDLINKALDDVSGQGMTALITFGTAHKYKILESLGGRDDIELLDTRGLFN
ncbi:hypothetical protein EH31_10130 [Erythrobacter longus]|uniref:Haem-binding uptake Tiki superfamily ChaN domain-containing protein n=1 Tax=Erythrobacter longus TaxID=1044 RepID=A0A074MXT0_ERYLO|nr:hypothetical protein [Erythrobacter longus]KEO90437.1 hypothetical protein EH31_10130 [Erythrobacter longus]